MPTKDNGQAGIPIDAVGNKALDPTQNVRELVAVALRNLAELRVADNALNTNARITLAASLEDEKRHIREVIDLQMTHARELAVAEAKRIDAIRAVDVGAVATAAERASQQATVLANQVATSAETLRALVATTANQVATALQNTSQQLTDRISLLEKSQYEIRGRGSVADPALEALAAEVRKLALAQSESVGKVAATDPALTVLTAQVKALVEAQAVNAGRAAVADPALSALALQVKTLVESQAQAVGKGIGSSAVIAYIVAAIGAAGTLILLVERLVGK